MNRVITDPTVRQKVYAVMTALVPILVGYGLISTADAAKYVALAGALGGALTTVLAALNTHTPVPVGRHAESAPQPEPVSDSLDVIPADQATSDTKSDAAL